MFWVKFSDLRPYLAQQQIFVSDDNNLPTCNYDDFFNLSMYKGDIYKTRNLKNRSLMQMYPEPDDLKRAQDSIQARLDDFEKKLWVPDREELLAMKEAKENAENSDEGESLEDIVAKPSSDSSDTDASAPAAPAPEEKKSVRSTSRSKKSDTGNKNSKNNKKNAKKPKVSKPQTTSSSAARSVRRKK